jgi:hypothetical protein
MNNQGTVREQYLREILGRDEGQKLSFFELVCCIALSIKVFVRFITKRL